MCENSLFTEIPWNQLYHKTNKVKWFHKILFLIPWFLENCNELDIAFWFDRKLSNLISRKIAICAFCQHPQRKRNFPLTEFDTPILFFIFRPFRKNCFRSRKKILQLSLDHHTTTKLMLSHVLVYVKLEIWLGKILFAMFSALQKDAA